MCNMLCNGIAESENKDSPFQSCQLDWSPSNRFILIVSTSLIGPAQKGDYIRERSGSVGVINLELRA